MGKLVKSKRSSCCSIGMPKTGKFCSVCQRIRPLEAFSEGYLSCDRCRSYRKNGKYYQSIKKYKNKNPDKVKLWRKNSYIKHQDEIKAQGKKYAQEHATENKESDDYMRILLRSKLKVRDELISDDMIKIEKVLIQIKRTFWKLKNGKSKINRKRNVGTDFDEEFRNLFSLLS